MGYGAHRSLYISRAAQVPFAGWVSVRPPTVVVSVPVVMGQFVVPFFSIVGMLAVSSGYRR